MGKKFNKNTRDEEFEDGDFYQNGYYDELAKRRNMKRMKNAMRSKNIDDLLEMEEDDYM